MKVKVLVTGANGQLAKTIKNLFENNEDNIVFEFLSKSDLDISSKGQIEHYFNKNKYQYCINCAAYTNVESAESYPDEAHLINATAVKYLSGACKLYKTKIIQISTDYVFDGKKTEPYKTGDITNPINEYGKSKLKGELYIQEILEEYYIIRASWLYSVYGKNFLKTIINKVEENSELNIITSQTGTPTSCIDLAEFIYFIIKEKNISYGIYHFSANGNATWYDFAKHIADKHKAYDKIKLNPVKFFKTKAERPTFSILDINKTEAVYKTLNHWAESVDNTLDVYKSNL